MTREDLLASLRTALSQSGAPGFAALVDQVHPADLALALRDVEADELHRLLLTVAPDPLARLYGYLEPAQQAEVALRMDRIGRIELLERLSADDRADLYNTLPEDAREALMPALAQADREDIVRLAAYPEGTVGALMTSEYALLHPDLNAREAVEHLRREAPDKETIYHAYVVDPQRRLLGVVSLRELIVAAATTNVETLMTRDVVSVQANAPVREAIKAIDHYDLLAVPVIDDGHALVGIVTVDDVLDSAEDEATEDFHKGGGSLPLKSTSLLGASTWLLYRKRVFWLVVLVFGNLLSSAGIAHFEDIIANYIALVFFLPLLIGSGGNAGSQASTLMVRSLATGDVRMRDWGRMLGREFAVAALLGLTMAVAVAPIGIYRGGHEIALTTSLSMVLIVLTGSIVGMSLPFLLSRLRLDPATSSAPLITSICDAIGVVIYLSIAVAVLGVPAVDG